MTMPLKESIILPGIISVSAFLFTILNILVLNEWFPHGRAYIIRNKLIENAIKERTKTGGINWYRLTPDDFSAVISSSVDNLPKARSTARRNAMGIVMTMKEGRMYNIRLNTSDNFTPLLTTNSMRLTILSMRRIMVKMPIPKKKGMIISFAMYLLTILTTGAIYHIEDNIEAKISG